MEFSSGLRLPTTQFVYLFLKVLLNTTSQNHPTYLFRQTSHRLLQLSVFVILFLYFFFQFPQLLSLTLQLTLPRSFFTTYVPLCPLSPPLRVTLTSRSLFSAFLSINSLSIVCILFQFSDHCASFSNCCASTL